MPTRFILVRHGETKWNQDNIYRGQTDIPLNEKGMNQADAAGKVLSSIPLDKIYTSPLLRAKQTAETIARYQAKAKEVVPDKGLIDPHFGSWQGKKVEEVSLKYPEEFSLWLNAPHKLTFPEGESLEIVRERAWNFVQKILAEHAGKTLCLVSHRVVVRLILLASLGLDSSKFWHIEQGNCALNYVTYNDKKGFVIQNVNDTCHLTPWSRTVSPAPPAD